MNGRNMNDANKNGSAQRIVARVEARVGPVHAGRQQSGYVARLGIGKITPMSDENGEWNLDDGFRLGDFEVYPKRLELVGGGKSVRLEFKVMAVLVCLAKRAGEVVTRDEIFREVWPNVYVGDEVLNRAISILREALGDSAQEPKYIMTVPRVGYRLIMKIERLQAPAKPELPPRGIHPPQLPIRLLVLGVLALVMVIVVLRNGPSQPDPRDRNRVAVLRFVNVPSDANPFFGDGLTNEIQSALARVPRLSVVGQQSVFLVDPHDDPREICKRLGCGSIIAGNVRRDGEHLRIAVEEINANTGFQTWSETYDFYISDTFAIQREIANSVRDHYEPEQSADRSPTRPTDTAAWTLYLRANQALRSREFPHAIELYRQAIERDPKFGRAYSELAEAYVLQPSYTGSSEKASHALARDAEDRAELLGEDPKRGSGMRAYMDARQRDWRAARDAFDEALTALPNNAEVLQWYSQFLASVGRIEAAKHNAELAVAADPLLPAANQRAGFLNIWSDRAAADRYFDTAADGSQRGLSEARLAYLLTVGRVDDAHKLLLDTQRARGQSTDWVEPALAAVTRTGPADVAIDALQRDYRAGTLGVSMYFGALFMIGDADAVYAALPEIIANGEPFDIEVFFSDSANGRVLRTDPRFVEWAQRLGLVDFWDSTHWPDKCARTGGTITCR